jgi:hypothetical protein
LARHTAETWNLVRLGREQKFSSTGGVQRGTLGGGAHPVPLSLTLQRAPSAGGELKKEGKMKKLLFVILSLFAVVAYADNTITSKEYVDGQVSNLQTQIPAKNTNTVVMNTGTAGTVGEKAIYDTSAAYGTQTDALVTAGAFNSAMQNALESEFVCIEWQGSVHDNAHCLLYEVRGATQTQSPNLLCEYRHIQNSVFDPVTGILTNTVEAARDWFQFAVVIYNSNSTVRSEIVWEDIYTTGTIRKITFVTPENANFIYIRHNDTRIDPGISFLVEPNTQYTLWMRPLAVNPSVIGGLQMQLMMVQGEYDSDEFIPCGNVYIPQSQ